MGVESVSAGIKCECGDQVWVWGMGVWGSSVGVGNGSVGIKCGCGECECGD